MFDSIGMWEILVLVVAGLFILGPERLPEAARWLGGAVRKVKEYTTGAQDHLKKELGPEYDQIRQPLDDLRSLRSFNPRRAITRSLFAEDEPTKPNGYAPGANGANGTNGTNGATSSANGAAAASGTAASAPVARPAQPSPSAGEQPPVDPDAT